MGRMHQLPCLLFLLLRFEYNSLAFDNRLVVSPSQFWEAVLTQRLNLLALSSTGDGRRTCENLAL